MTSKQSFIGPNEFQNSNSEVDSNVYFCLFRAGVTVTVKGKTRRGRSFKSNLWVRE